MRNAEKAANLRKYVTKPHGVWSWPTDGCGYEQHKRFIKYRDTHWHGGTPPEWIQFVLTYADHLYPSRL